MLIAYTFVFIPAHKPAAAAPHQKAEAYENEMENPRNTIPKNDIYSAAHPFQTGTHTHTNIFIYLYTYIIHAHKPKSAFTQMIAM